MEFYINLMALIAAIITLVSAIFVSAKEKNANNAKDTFQQSVNIKKNHGDITQTSNTLNYSKNVSIKNYYSSEGSKNKNAVIFSTPYWLVYMVLIVFFVCFFSGMIYWKIRPFFPIIFIPSIALAILSQKSTFDFSLHKNKLLNFLFLISSVLFFAIYRIMLLIEPFNQGVYISDIQQLLNIIFRVNTVNTINLPTLLCYYCFTTLTLISFFVIFFSQIAVLVSPFLKKHTNYLKNIASYWWFFIIIQFAVPLLYLLINSI